MLVQKRDIYQLRLSPGASRPVSSAIASGRVCPANGSVALSVVMCRRRGHDIPMCEVNVPAAVAFSGLSPLVVEDVVDEGERVVVWARTPDSPVVCPGCGAESERLHGYHWRTVTDVPLDGRPVVVRVQVRRLVCPTTGCCNTFREQVAGVLERYQRRTARLTRQVRVVVRELAGRAGARLLARLSVGLSPAYGGARAAEYSVAAAAGSCGRRCR